MSHFLAGKGAKITAKSASPDRPPAKTPKSRGLRASANLLPQRDGRLFSGVRASPVGALQRHTSSYTALLGRAAPPFSPDALTALDKTSPSALPPQRVAAGRWPAPGASDPCGGRPEPCPSAAPPPRPHVGVINRVLWIQRLDSAEPTHCSCCCL